MDSIFGKGENRTSSWESEPTRRGTFTILSTCLITLSLCAFTAVHLNIPERGKAKYQTLRKLGWMVLAVFAPELIVFTAYRQRRQAGDILEMTHKDHIRRVSPSWWTKSWAYSRRYITGSHSQQKDPELGSSGDESHHLPSWTMVHSHYALMGGLAVELQITKEIQRYTIDFETLKTMLTKFPDAIPTTTTEEIMDKSKADGLAKSLVCLQATWFCIQCVSRMAQGLSISLLELNTFGHSLCALLMYLLWWHKPFNIDGPTIIRNEPFLAYMEGIILKYRIEETPYDGVRVTFDPKSRTFMGVDISEAVDESVDSCPEEEAVRLYMGQSLYGIQYRWSRLHTNGNIRNSKPSQGVLNALSRPYILLSEHDRRD